MNIAESKVRLSDLFDQVWEGLCREFVETIREGMEELLERTRDNIVGKRGQEKGTGTGEKGTVTY
jgi:hypothetical protein